MPSFRRESIPTRMRISSGLHRPTEPFAVSPADYACTSSMPERWPPERSYGHKPPSFPAMSVYHYKIRKKRVTNTFPHKFPVYSTR